MSTFKQEIDAKGIQLKRAEKDLTEILASHGEDPIYQWRLNRLRAGYRPTSAETKALHEYLGITEFRDDPTQPFKAKRYK